MQKWHHHQGYHHFWQEVKASHWKSGAKVMPHPLVLPLLAVMLPFHTRDARTCGALFIFLDLSKQPLDPPIDIWIPPCGRSFKTWLGSLWKRFLAVFGGLCFGIFAKAFRKWDFGSNWSLGYLTFFFISCFDYFNHFAIIKLIFFDCNWIFSFSLDWWIIRFESWILKFVFLPSIFIPKFGLIFMSFK